MLYLKSCARCSGDINADGDTHGTFLKCLQSGFSKDLSPEMASRLLTPRMTPVVPIIHSVQQAS
jgi:hypothetical protein